MVVAWVSEGEPNVETYELRYLFPTTASIAGGGSAVAVAFTTGQVGFLRDGAWIEPDVLQAERSAHNGYQHGWAALDPDGELLLTRRDSADLELWAASGSGLERLGRLANSDASEAPDFASFSGDDITVASATAFHYDTGTATAVTPRGRGRHHTPRARLRRGGIFPPRRGTGGRCRPLGALASNPSG